MAASFHVLTVCTGNVCRSPMAEIMLRAAFANLPNLAVTVASAGTGALVGMGMTVEAKAVLAGLGLPDEPPHAARQLTPQLVRAADLALALTRNHRKAIVELDPTAMKRSFTVREFGYVAGCLSLEHVIEARQFLEPDQVSESEPLNRLRSAVAAVHSASGIVAPSDQAEYDIADPFGRPLEAYATVAHRLIPAIEVAAEFFYQAMV